MKDTTTGFGIIITKDEIGMKGDVSVKSALCQSQSPQAQIDTIFKISKIQLIAKR
jgi:hypothetical protein